MQPRSLHARPRFLMGGASAAALVLAAQAFAQAGGDARVAGAPTSVSWTTYTPGNTGIQGDYVQAIVVDASDDPWIAGYTPIWEQGGMAHWDGDRWFNVSNVDHPKIASPRFSDIVTDAAGRMWIASDAGLLVYDPSIGPASLQRLDPSNSPLPADQLRDLALAPDGSLWIAIGDVQSVPAGGLARYEPAAGTWQVWTTATGLPWGEAWPGWDMIEFVAVVPDPDGGFTVWFGSQSMGVATYRDGAFSWFGVPSLLPWNAPITPVEFPSAGAVDDLGNLWVMTNKGLARRAPDGSYQFTGVPTSTVSCVFALSGGRAAAGTYYSDVFLWDGEWISLGNWGSLNHTYAIAEDSAGALWVGGIGGAAKLEGGTWQRHRITNSGLISYFPGALEFGSAGEVYVGGNAGPGIGGFNIFDGVHWIGVNDANYGLGPAWGLPSDDVAAMALRANGHLLIAPSGLQGLLDWDGVSYTYLIPQGFDVVDVDEDGLGRPWAAHPLGGVTLVHSEGRIQFTSSNSALPAGTVGSVVADAFRPGFVWIGAQFGIAHTDGRSWTVYPRELLGLTLNSLGYHITCLEPAPDGSLWVGSGRGLFHFHPETLQYEQYTPANSALPSDEVYELEKAPDGTLWVATFDSTYPYPGGLTHYDGRRFTTYTASNSRLPHNQIWDLAARRVGGGYELWIATASEGLAVLSVERTLPEPAPSRAR